MAKPFERPPAIWIYCTVRPTTKNGLTKPDTHRVGTCQHGKDIPKLIADDRKAMQDTFGGLISSPGIEGRTYRAFRAKWTEIEVDEAADQRVRDIKSGKITEGPALLAGLMTIERRR